MTGGEQILHYRVIRALGAGGMGEVFLAEDERLGRRVALKFLPRADSADSERRERLRREARALASLSHPAIAGIFALEEHEDRMFLVMEYIEGETLADRLAGRPLPVGEVLERGRMLAEALAHAHARGVVHRDIKPSNVLITSDGATKLADFGLALHEGDTRLTAEGSTAGTADHMSPEQTRGETPDRRSDLFSLGVALYEALTGVSPFRRATLEATFAAIRGDDPEPPTGLRSGVPLELERIVMKLLRKNTAERYPSADDLVADLRALQSRGMSALETATAVGETTAVGGGRGSVGLGDTVAPKARVPLRRRWLMAAPAVLLVGALAYLAFGTRRHGNGEANAAQQSIAVVSFQNMKEPADPRREAVMAASLLTVGLGQTQVVPVVGAQRVHDVLKQMGKADQAVSGADALQVGKRSGATYVVTGYVFQTSPTMVIGAEVASVENGAVLTSRRVQVAGGDQAIFAAVDSLTVALRDGLAQAGFGVRRNPVDVGGQTTRNPAALRAFAQGLDLLYQSDWPEARGAFLAAVAADSTFPQAWYYLAVSTWWSADFPEAQRDVERGLKLGSRLSERDRGALEGLRALTQLDYDEARERYRLLTQRYPDEKEFWYGLGEALYHGQKDNEGARAAMLKALALDPQFGVARIHIIDVDIAREDLKRALEDSNRLQRMDPKSPLGDLDKIVIFGQLGYPESSLAYARRVTRAPSIFWVYRSMGVLYAMLGYPDSAEAMVPDVIRTAGPLAPTIPPIATSWLSCTSGRFHEAEREATSGMRQMGIGVPDAYAQLLVIRALSLVELGRNEDAARLVLEEQARALRSPAHKRLVGPATMVDLLLRAGHIADARRELREYDREIRTPGRRKDARMRQDRDYAAGLLALAEGHAREAVGLFERSRPAADEAAQDPLRRWGLARALLAAGDHGRAVVELEKASRRLIYSGNVFEVFHVMMVLAREYERAGRRNDALALYRRVAFQFRNAEPGTRINDEARAGIARLTAVRARA